MPGGSGVGVAVGGAGVAVGVGVGYGVGVDVGLTSSDAAVGRRTVAVGRGSRLPQAKPGNKPSSKQARSNHRRRDVERIAGELITSRMEAGVTLCPFGRITTFSLQANDHSWLQASNKLS